MLEGGFKQCMPRLIIAGQFKCGTTSLFDTLARHTSILLPSTSNTSACVVKEVNGFTRTHVDASWDDSKLSEIYQRTLPYQRLDDPRIVLEATPFYFSGLVDGQVCASQGLLPRCRF